MNEEVQITVTNADRYREFIWKITDADGIDTDRCANMLSPVVTCTFDTAGEIHISVDATDRNGEKTLYELSVDILDPSTRPNQNPYIVLKMKNAGTDAQYGIVATLKKEETGGAVFPRGDDVAFDFSATRDDKDASSALKYELDLGTGFNEIPMLHTMKFMTVTTIAARVRATDTEGNATVKSFTIFVRCKDGDQAPVTINTSNIAINANGALNYFSFNASSAASGGIGSYKVMWDFNGDGAYDTDWINNTSTTNYTIFAETRNVGIKVWETGCNYFASATMPYDFVIAHANGTPGVPQGPQIPGYHFIQADITGLGGNYSKAANASYIATRSNSAPTSEPRRVICDYKKKGTETSRNEGSSMATFTIFGLNKYDKLAEAGIQHGMALSIDGIIDPTGMMGTGTVDTSKAFVSRAAYYTDGGPDNVADTVYTKQGDCDVNITVTPLPPGPGTCSDNPDFGYPVLIDATYSCPVMRSKEGWELSATSGAIYCEVAQVEACPPGGGGGGGGLPPIPR